MLRPRTSAPLLAISAHACVIFLRRVGASKDSLATDRIPSAHFFPGASRALRAFRRPGKPGMDVQHWKPSARHRFVPESQRTDSRHSYLDYSGFGNLVLVRVAG